MKSFEDRITALEDEFVELRATILTGVQMAQRAIRRGDTKAASAALGRIAGVLAARTAKLARTAKRGRRFDA